MNKINPKPLELHSHQEKDTEKPQVHEPISMYTLRYKGFLLFLN